MAEKSNILPCQYFALQSHLRGRGIFPHYIVRPYYIMEKAENQTYVRKIFRKVLTKNACSCMIQTENEKMFERNGAKTWKEEHREEL